MCSFCSAWNKTWIPPPWHFAVNQSPLLRYVQPLVFLYISFVATSMQNCVTVFMVSYTGILDKHKLIWVSFIFHFRWFNVCRVVTVRLNQRSWGFREAFGGNKLIHYSLSLLFFISRHHWSYSGWLDIYMSVFLAQETLIMYTKLLDCRCSLRFLSNFTISSCILMNLKGKQPIYHMWRLIAKQTLFEQLSIS